MRVLITILLSCILLAGPFGCRAARERCDRRPYAARDLLLSRTADLSRAAQAFAGRSSWPSVEHGYRFDDVQTYTEVIFDDQSFFDREGGGHQYITESVRTGVFVR